MCDQCFKKLIFEFYSGDEWSKFIIVLDEKIKNGQMDYIGNYEYSCKNCNEIWAHSIPENSYRGYFLTLKAEEGHKSKN